MADGGETNYNPQTGDYVDKNGVSTNERQIAHTNKSVVPANGKAMLVAGATAKSELDIAYEQYGRLSKLAKQRQQQAYDKTLAENTAYYKDHTFAYVARSLLTGDEDMIQKEARAASFDRDETDFLSPVEAAQYNQAQATIAGKGDGIAHALGTGLVNGTGILSEEHPEGSREDLHQQASTNEHPVARFIGELGPGIFFSFLKGKGGRAPKEGETPPQTTSQTPKSESAPDTKPSGTSSEPVPVGEPVSVANGEYLETWRDFLIPGTLAFDGARYMGLKLAMPRGYVSPLGPCQISMFDEVFSNPERGKLMLHDAGGKAIFFDRPFNFLPSINPAHPHLELKAPWLKQLQLKDRGIVKHFKQYDDGIYRLERIEDLNSNALTFGRSEEGWLQRIDGPDGLSLSFGNDAHGRRTRIALLGVDGSELELGRYGYDTRGRMTEATCAFGMSVRYIWQADGDLISSWHNLARQSETHFTYDQAGRVIQTRTNGIWNGDRFEYEEGATRYLPGGNERVAQTFEYDENENVTAEIDALGGTVAHVYDRHGFRTSTTDQNGNAGRTRYDIHGNVKEVTDPEGRSTIYGWGDNGELMIVIDGAGNRKTYDHDDKGNVIAEKDAEGNLTRLTRDARGRVTETHLPNGAIERRAWDKYNRLESVTDAKGNTTRFEYDVFNRLTAVIDPTGRATCREYGAGAGGFDTPSKLIRPDGVAAIRSFDGQGQVASVTDGEGRTWTYRNGAFGILQSITDPKGGVLSFDYDIEGRIIAVTNASHCVYRYGRDTAGRVVEEEDFDGRVTAYRRDAAGQVIEKIKPDGVKLAYGYDKSGLVRRIESFDARGAPEDVTRFWYDGRGLLIQAENRAALVEFERDRNGRITGETLNGKRIRSKRDAMGSRILREITGLGGGLVEYLRDPLGAVEKMTVGETEIAFRHDVLGRETGREIGGFSLAQRYDDAGQLVAQAAGSKSPVELGISRLGWNVPSGEGTPRRSGAVSRVYEYDRAFAPVRIDDGMWGEIRFDYDDNGQLVSAEGARGAERFSYDEARNLAGASSSIPFSSMASGYGPSFDAAFGTVTPAQKPSGWQRTPGGVVQIARGPKGERIQLEHDACGRLIERRVERDGFRPERWRYRWDAHDRLVAVVRSDGEEWLFRYDPFGRRVSKVRRFPEKERERASMRWPAYVGGDGAPQPARATTSVDKAPDRDNGLPIIGTSYLWDGAHMVTEAPLRLDGHVAWDEAVTWHFEGGESDDDAASHRLLAKELPAGAALPDGTVIEKTAIFPVVCDHLGTPKEMFDRRGNLVWVADHYIWGEIRATGTFGNLAAKPAHDRQLEVFACPWRFPGQYEDAETGLFYNRNRHYDPLTGQYASPDPIGLTGGDRPQGYVQNPAAWTDPLGLSAQQNVYERPPSSAPANWNTARAGEWSRIGELERQNPTGKYSPANIDRMLAGKAPQMRIVVRNRRTGAVQTRDVPIELHHQYLPQRGASARANESWNLTPSTPWGHEAMDPYRHTGYDLLRVLNGPNSWTP